MENDPNKSDGKETTPPIVVLWDVPEDEWSNWRAAECGDDESHAEYRTRLIATAAELERQGVTVHLISPSVWHVMEWLDELDVDNTPSGRAAALAAIWKYDWPPGKMPQT